MLLRQCMHTLYTFALIVLVAELTCRLDQPGRDRRGQGSADPDEQRCEGFGQHQSKYRTAGSGKHGHIQHMQI